MPESNSRVLVVATSHAEMGATGHRTGVWLEELAVPYYVLRDGGADVTLASVAGGEIPFDPRSLPSEAGEGPGEEPAAEQEIHPAVRRFLTDEEAMRAVRSSPAVDEFGGGRGFDAVLLPGGHGTMWDMPESEPLARFVGAIFDRGDIVAAVCHGPAGLVSAKRSDGRPVVEGRRANAFTNSEEDGVGLTNVVPFLLEDRLKELGAFFKCGRDWQPYAVQDGNLITGQNPQSSELVARHILVALGVREAV